MKTKALTIGFMFIILSLFLVNIPNGFVSLQPIVKEYVLHEEVEEADSVRDIISQVEASYNDSFVSKMQFVEIQGINRKAIGSRWYNTVLRLKNNYLTYRYDVADVETYSNHLSELNDYVKQNGAEFLYVAVPFKTSPLDVSEQIPSGTFERSNENQDTMLDLLDSKSVKTYDLRPRLVLKYPDWYPAYFRTDQHWKPETAFWAYGEMSNFLAQEYGYREDERSKRIENYNIDSYKKWFLGSQGKKTGIIYSGLDDFSVIYPKFETDMTVDVPVHNEHREGSFSDVMLKKKFLKKDYYNINTYCTYIGGDYPLCIQRNHTAKNNKRILILKDSFTIAFQPYMSFMFSEVDVIDLRHYKESLKDYIDKTDPDLIMVFYTSSMMAYPEAYQFGLD